MHLLKLFFIVLASFSNEVLSQFARYNTAVIPIIKDAKSSLHKVTTSFSEPRDEDLYYLIDLDAPFTWIDCVLHSPREVACGLEEGCRFPLSCDTTFCQEAHTYINPICSSLNITAKYGCKICSVTPFNPISKSCKISQLTTDLVKLYDTNGRNPSWGSFSGFGQRFVLSCAPSSVLKSFPKGVRGVAAFSWSTLAFPRQVYMPGADADTADKFALCLPSSSSALGVTFLGDGPFYFTSFPNLDLRSFLSYTPMTRASSMSLGYYIQIKRFSITGIPIPPLPKSISVKFSTVVPYTTLRSDIYKGLVTSFSKAAKHIPRVKAVQPFSLCYKAKAIGSLRTGFRVPKIDLKTESGKIWTISGDNSMKNMGNGVVCLAFIDGGLGVKDAIVIGTYQMENNFLFFDLENQRLGFSSSLLARGTSCGNFNFTLIPE